MPAAERGDTGPEQRFELDLLQPIQSIEVAVVGSSDLDSVVALARREVAGVRVKDAAVARVYRHNPVSIFAFRRGGKIVGSVAYLYLTEEGLDRLLLNAIDFADPEIAILSPPSMQPSAIYFWALVARGHVGAGLGGTNAWTCASPYARANYYARPSSDDGRRFVQRYGFERMQGYQQDLWRYQRLCNRAAIERIEKRASLLHAA